MTIIPRIGTAGWAVPRRFADRFPREGSQLERYAQRLDAAEINSSFYRPHQQKTYARWAASVPADFRFSIKLPKAISHGPAPSDHAAAIAAFADQALGLGDKLGVVLVQFAPNRAFAPDSEALFAALAGRLPCPIACEPRHASWFTPVVEDWLASRRIARVAADPPLAPGADAPGGWPGLRYHRLHGSPEIYRSSYDAAALARLHDTLAGPGERWSIFDNTASCAATGNALALAAGFAGK